MDIDEAIAERDRHVDAAKHIAKGKALGKSVEARIANSVAESVHWQAALYFETVADNMSRET